MKLRCIAVDDEPHALGLVAGYIEKTPFLELAGTFGSGLEVVEWLRTDTADLVFLDIDMPDLTGLELSRMLPKGIQVVFTTAHDRYAVESYRVDALDYLLKPFSYSEFLEAAQKASSQNQHHETEVPANDFIFVKSDYKLKKIPFQDIRYIEGLKDYVKIYTGPKPILSLLKLKAMEEVLPKDQFLRVHRSFIVNLMKVEMIERSRIVMDGVVIPVGDQYKAAFQEFLGKHSP